MATIIKYDGTKFSLDGDTSYNILSEYTWGPRYTVPINIEIIPYDEIVDEPAPWGASTVVLKITAGKMTTDSEEYDSDILNGGVSLDVYYSGGEIEIPSSQIAGFDGSKYKYVGLDESQLTKESSFELEIYWESLVNSLIAQGTQTITINTPVYYTAPTLSTSITGTSNRGNITFKWNFSEGINNPLEEYKLIIQVEVEDGLPETVKTVNLNTSTNSYIYTEGNIGRSYTADLTVNPTYGKTQTIWSGYTGIPWKPLIFRKTSSGWEEIDNIDYVKTPEGWGSAKQIFFKTEDGWKEI